VLQTGQKFCRINQQGPQKIVQPDNFPAELGQWGRILKQFRFLRFTEKLDYSQILSLKEFKQLVPV
jgi:hypothetical protein